MAVIPDAIREEKLQLSSLVIDVEPMRQVLQAARNSDKPLKKTVALSRLAPTYCRLYAFACRLSRASQLGLLSSLSDGSGAVANLLTIDS